MDDLIKVKYDPIEQQSIVLDTILGGTINTENPTNPLVSLIEAVSVTTAGALQEFTQAEKYTFVSLATKETELYPHITNQDEENLFASPATTKVKVFMDLNSVLTAGIYEDNIYKITIPKYSTIDVDNTILTISNDIKVFVSKKDNEYVSFVEHDITDKSVEFTNIGTIYSTITTLEDNTQWVTFEVPVTQMSVTVVESRATLGIDFMTEIPITDQYYYSKVEYLDVTTNTYVELNKTYVFSVFDLNTPTAYIELLENSVKYKIPKLHMDNLIKSNTLRFTIYTTKGKIRIPLSKYSPEDFKFTLYKNKDDIYKAAAFNINYIITSPNILDGGVNRRTIRDMRKKFIYRTTGNIQTPITEYQLMEDARLDGFYLDKVTDTLNERIYVASKDINDFTDINVPMNVYNISARLEEMENKQDSFLIENDFILVKPFTVFKNANGIVKPISKLEIDYIQSLTNTEKARYLNTNDLTYNPFLYVIDNNANIVSSRIYSVNRPRMDMLSITNKNKNLKENVNITGYSIVREGDDFLLFFRLTGNDAYNLVKDKISLQLRMDSEYGSVYYTSFVDTTLSESYIGKENDVVHIIRIKTDNLKVNNNDQFILSPDDPQIGTISLSSKSDIVIYYNGTDLTSTGGTQLTANTYLNTNEVVNVQDVIGLTREKINITLADKLEYLWNRVDNVYTTRKYKTYPTDVPKLYPKDVYADNALPFTLSDTNGDGICDALNFNIVHRKGEIVYDTNGNVVYEHRKGDVVYENGVPVIDTIAGIARFTDMVMFEYKYLSTNKPIYKTHADFIEDLLLEWILNKIQNINNSTLDNTKVLFKARRSKNLVTSKTGMSYSAVITPRVTLYYRKDTKAFDLDFNTLYKDIGTVLNRYFSKPYIIIQDLEKAITDILDGSLLTVNVSDYIDGDPKIIDLETFSNRFELRKTVSTEMVISHEYILDIKYI